MFEAYVMIFLRIWPSLWYLCKKNTYQANSCIDITQCQKIANCCSMNRTSREVNFLQNSESDDFQKTFGKKNVLLCKTKICRNSFFCERKLFSWAGEDFSWTWKWCASMVGLKQLWKKREFVVMNWKRSSWDRESWWDRKEKVFLRKSERGVQQEIQRDWLCHTERERLLRKVKKEIQRDR